MQTSALELAEAPVFRLHLRSTLPHVDHAAIEDYCLKENGWAGLGWGLWEGEQPSGLAWDEYTRRKEAKGEGVDESVRRLHNMPVGALVWTRRTDGTFWLGRITGKWEYRAGPQARKLDMFNLRRCRWHNVGAEDAVPGKILNNFRPARTLNPVKDHASVDYSRRLWSRVTGEPFAEAPIDSRTVIESLLSPTDLEDFVAAYLQDRHDLVLISRHPSTAGYEYVFKAKRDGRRAVASVKSGGSNVDLSTLPKDGDIDVWIYQVSGEPAGESHDNVRHIATEDLVDFINERPTVQPDQVLYWLNR